MTIPHVFWLENPTLDHDCCVTIAQDIRQETQTVWGSGRIMYDNVDDDDDDDDDDEQKM